MIEFRSAHQKFNVRGSVCKVLIIRAIIDNSKGRGGEDDDVLILETRNNS